MRYYNSISVADDVEREARSLPQNRRMHRLSMPKAIVTVFCLYALSTLYQDLFEAVPVNWILGFTLAGMLLLHFIQKMSRSSIVIVVLILIGALLALIQTKLISDDVAQYAYWVVTLLLLQYMATSMKREDARATFASCKPIIIGSVLVFGISIIAMLRFHIGFVAAWGGGEYFHGLSFSEHTMASLCCLMLAFALVWVCLYNYRIIALIMACIVSYALFETGARVFLIPCVLIWVAIIDHVASSKTTRILSFLLFAAVAIYIFFKSNMFDKFMYSLSGMNSGADPLSYFTSGRSSFWVTDLISYSKSNIIGYIFGNSFNSVYEINQQMNGMRIWAHNDFIMLLCSTGILGLAAYLKVLASYLKSIYQRAGVKNGLLVSVGLVLPAFLNGFYGYQHLVFAIMTVGMALVATAGKSGQEKIATISEGDGSHEGAKPERVCRLNNLIQSEF